MHHTYGHIMDHSDFTHCRLWHRGVRELCDVRGWQIGVQQVTVYDRTERLIPLAII